MRRRQQANAFQDVDQKRDEHGFIPHTNLINKFLDAFLPKDKDELKRLFYLVIGGIAAGYLPNSGLKNYTLPRILTSTTLGFFAGGIGIFNKMNTRDKIFNVLNILYSFYGVAYMTDLLLSLPSSPSMRR
jgi:hypothetical protein